MVITRKIEIGVERQDEEKYKQAWSLLNLLNDTIYKAANTIVSHQYFNHELRHRLEIHHEDYRKSKKELDKIEAKLLIETDKTKIAALRTEKKDIYEKQKQYKKEIDDAQAQVLQTSLQNTTYQVVASQFPNIPSNIATTLNSVVQKSYKAAFKELLAGERSLPTYRKGMPIPFNGVAWDKNEKGEPILKWLKGIRFHLRFGRDRSNNKSIVERILAGEYKACDSSIQIKDNKIFLLLVVEIGEVKQTLDPAVVVGIDLGINIPLFIALNEGYAREAIGSRDEFLNVRLRLQKQKRSLQRALKETQGGRGRAKKLEALDHTEKAESNWVRTQNHTFAKRVVEFALRHRAGTIQMEHLAGIGTRTEGSFILRNWSYFELQNLIAYKAKYQGIEVRLVDPKYTSRTCSWCGHEDKENRQSQDKFLCLNPDCTNKNDKGENQVVNADFNAARNIAKSDKVHKVL